MINIPPRVTDGWDVGLSHNQVSPIKHVMSSPGEVRMVIYGMCLVREVLSHLQERRTSVSMSYGCKATNITVSICCTACISVLDPQIRTGSKYQSAEFKPNQFYIYKSQWTVAYLDIYRPETQSVFFLRSRCLPWRCCLYYRRLCSFPWNVSWSRQELIYLCARCHIDYVTDEI